MKKTKVETKKPKKEVVAEVSYRIFKLSSEGHLKEPMTHGYDGEEHIFDNWSGYPSIEDARLAILEHAKKQTYNIGCKYIVIPFIQTGEVINELP